MNVRLSITVDTATPEIVYAWDQLEDKTPMMKAAGHRLVRDTSAHVRAWGRSHPNKLGGKRTNYWSTIAEKINPADCLQVTGSQAVMTLDGNIMPGITRAFEDVTITPGTKTPGVKNLALPARSESYGMRPGEMSGLVLFWGKAGPAGLAQGVPVTRAKSTKKGAKGTTYMVPGLVMYWFSKKVTQPTDRSLLPSNQEWTDSASDGASEWLDIQFKKLKS